MKKETKEQVNVPTPFLTVQDALNAGAKGIDHLVVRFKEAGVELPHVISVQISTGIKYRELLMADVDVSTTKDAYTFGINNGSLVVIWRHLQILGYVAD